MFEVDAFDGFVKYPSLVATGLQYKKNKKGVGLSLFGLAMFKE